MAVLMDFDYLRNGNFMEIAYLGGIVWIGGNFIWRNSITIWICKTTQSEFNSSANLKVMHSY